MRSPALRPLRDRHPKPADFFSPFELRLPASGSELSSARDSVADAAVAFGLQPRARYEFVYAVNEAVTNAIKHGSPDRDGMIGLRVDCEGDSIVCSVSDCGPWVSAQTDSSLDSGEGGRGLVLMSALTDEVELSVEPQATVVRLRKRRGAAVLVPGA
jgi:serine/threonine-protein kinase RsbW